MRFIITLALIGFSQMSLAMTCEGEVTKFDGTVVGHVILEPDAFTNSVVTSLKGEAFGYSFEATQSVDDNGLSLLVNGLYNAARLYHSYSSEGVALDTSAGPTIAKLNAITPDLNFVHLVCKKSAPFPHH